ncbi:MAG: isopeptide-forming domain-containing fimbrial protein [Lachnospiraceae bacterium]|nr:isopeptide-forming domain-containing fimbrial protein [Lachnospiraceae bacterium]
MKKIWSIVLALLMVLGCTVTAFADEAARHVITITNEKAGHVYEAYQIFKGDLDTTKTILSNVEWGAGIDGVSFLAALQEKNAYKECSNAAEVAEVLTGFQNDSSELDAFAETAELYLNGTAAGRSTEEKSPYTIPVTGDGYYLVKDSGVIGNGDAYTKFILQVVRDVQVEAKADAPVLEKKILEDGESVEANSVSVGDTVTYEITSHVPDMDGYEKYFFVVHDTLDEGLTFQPDSLEVELGGQRLDTSSYQLQTEQAEDGCTFELVLKNFIQYKDRTDAKIAIRYSAVVNTNAVIGNAGNVNKAHLEYSNNPNVKQNGTEENPDRPGFGDVTGVTPDDVTVSYLTGIELIKVDDSDIPIRLQGAEFKISGEKLNQVKVVKGVFTESEQGTYFKLKDGTYTETAPLTETVDRYENTEVTYVCEAVTEWITVTEEVDTTAMVGLNGELHFYGLAAGTYEIEEITAPNGYNLLKEPIVIEIKLDVPDTVTTGEEEAEWKYSVSGAMVQDETEAQTGLIQLSVINKAGIILPSTGGMGVYGFYAVGILLAIAAIVTDSRKNRRNKMNEM